MSTDEREGRRSRKVPLLQLSSVIIFVTVLFFSAMDCHASEAETPEEVHIEAQHMPDAWRPPCVLAPQLPKAPGIDGVAEAGVWDGAAHGPIAYPQGSSEAQEPDTFFRIGHFDGVLYVLLESSSLDGKAPKRYAEENGLRWILGFLGERSKTSVPGGYGVSGIPATFLIDPDGRVVDRSVGNVEAIKAAVEKALGQE